MTRDELQTEILRNKGKDVKISEVTTLLKNGKITEMDLMDWGIPEKVANACKDFQYPVLINDAPPSEIEKNISEVYLWGMPGSSKTCTLAAILRTGQIKTILSLCGGNGYQYAEGLTNIFNIENIGYLPNRTNRDVTQALRCTITEKAKKPREHQVAFIEISGEIFKCFREKYAKDNKQSNNGLTNIEDENTYNNLTRLLTDKKNKKLHFFIIDHTFKEDGKFGLPTQENYLAATAQFFKINRIFNENTLGIYVIIAKSDQLSNSIEAAEKELLNGTFGNFINQLKVICQQESINDGNKLKYLLFSIGKVYFQNICELETDSSEIILKHIEKKTGVKQQKKRKILEDIKSFFES